VVNAIANANQPVIVFHLLKLNVAIFLENVILNFSYKENVFLSNATSNNKNLQKKRVALKK
jgi:hypothetical protein